MNLSTHTAPDVLPMARTEDEFGAPERRLEQNVRNITESVAHGGSPANARKTRLSLI